jgi:HD-GYP domain-containing protein (c-di-GMP phosphodiesterase class II)
MSLRPLRRTPVRSVAVSSDQDAARERRLLWIGIVLLAVPLALFGALHWFATGADAQVIVPTEHFLAVSAACIVALGLAVVLSYAAVRTREPRTFFLAAAYLMIAAPFSVHGLMTPGQTFSMHSFHNSMVVSAQMSLVLGALALMLAARPLPRLLDGAIRNQFGPLMTGTVLLSFGYVLLCLSIPAILDWVPTGGEPAGLTTVLGLDRHAVGLTIRYAAMSASIVMSLIATVRFYRSFATTRSFVTATVAISAALLGESLFIQSFGVVWNLSWWLYHVLLLIAVVLPMTAFALLYRRGSSLIAIVDSLLLTETLAKVEYSFPDAIEGFITTVEERDPYLKGHMRRVCELVVAIADQMRAPDTVIRAASYAALLHDIGKLGLPHTVLNKPGRLTDDEFAVLKQHPARGFALVANIESLRSAAPAIRWHHERLDGTGYPDALAGDAVPLEARIIAVADVWDALTSDRVYRTAMSHAEARAVLTAERGSKLDAECVDALLAVVERANAVNESGDVALPVGMSMAAAG